MPRTRRSRRVKNTITTPHNGWSVPVRLDKLGESGLLAYSVLRGPAGSTVTAVDILVYAGEYTEAAATVPPLVPDEDKVFERTGIVVAGHATDADDEYNILGMEGGKVYDVLDEVAVRPPVGALWVALKGTAGSAPDDLVLSLDAVDVV